MSDGAHQGLRADAAMKAILAGEDPGSPMSETAFEQMIREAPLDQGWDYGTASNAIARLVLKAYEDYPMLREVPDDVQYLVDANGNKVYSIKLTNSLYDVIKQLYPEHYDDLFSGMTGFMWGWAVNAARSILDLGPLPNPALLTISI